MLIADANSMTQAEDLLKFCTGLEACVVDAGELMPGAEMTEPASITMLKQLSSGGKCHMNPC